MERWQGIERPYSEGDVERLKGKIRIDHTLARLASKKLWDMMTTQDDPVRVFVFAVLAHSCAADY